MTRWLILACVAMAVAGCGNEGAAEAGGNTASLSKEIPQPKADAPTFDPPGHNLNKESPGSIGEGVPGATGPQKKGK